MREALVAIGVIILLGTIFVLCSIGCKSGPVAGDESLVEARIINAVNAERNRWTKELSQHLTDGLGEIDQRVDAVGGNFEQVVFAAREYRQFILTTLDRFLPVGSEEQIASSYPACSNSNHNCLLDPEDCAYN